MSRQILALLCLVALAIAEQAIIPPAQNCVVSDWYDPDPSTGYLTCSKTCGTGYRTQYRKVLIPPGPGGLSCPELAQTIQCQVNPCPVDCILSEWVPFNTYEDYYAAYAPYGQTIDRNLWRGLCSATCSSPSNNGTRMVFKTVVTPAAHGGLECPPSSKLVYCNQQYCPIDGVVSQWAAYDSYGDYLQYFQNQNYFTEATYGGVCSRSCGGGTRQVFRYVITQPAYGGKALPPLFKTVTCNTQACPGDCVVSDWSTYNSYSQYLSAMGTATYVVSADQFTGSCTVSCGTGVRTVFRKVLSPALDGGVPCPALTKTNACNVQACPGDCVVSQWAYYDSYSSYYAIASGYPNYYPEYAFQGLCSKSCGGGVRTYYRYITQQATFAGKTCPPLTKTVSCNPLPCPQDCVVGEWNQYDSYDVYATEYTGAPGFYVSPDFWPGVCSKSCGNGTRLQFRKVVQQPQYGGHACPVLSRPVPCNEQYCPIDAVVSQWAVYDDYGQYVAIMGNSAYGNDAWYGVCSKSCGGGLRRSYRYITRAAQYGGKPSPRLYKEVACNTQACPGDCDVSQWTQYSNYQEYYADLFPTGNYLSRDLFHGTCDKSCGTGVRHLYRKVIRPASNGGLACPTLSKSVPCNTQLCPVDGLVSQWSAYTDYQAYYNVAYATGYYEDEYHFQGTCSASCGGGYRYLYRTVTRAPQYGGAPVPALSKRIVCNTQACPQDCVLSQWGTYENYESYYQAMVVGKYSYVPRTAFQGSCDKSCGNGTRTIYRAVVKAAQNGGAPCGELTRVETCANVACPGDCVVSQWSSFESYADYYSAFHTYGFYEPEYSFNGVCTKSCGIGSRYVYRYIVKPALAGGRACPSLTKEIKCNTQQCPGDCLVSQWSSFAGDVNTHLNDQLGAEGSQCSVTCGGGQLVLYRSVIRPALANGLECPPLSKTVACNPRPCPVDALVSQWATYDAYEYFYAAMSGYGGSAYSEQNWRGQCTKTCGGGVRTAFRYVIQAPAYGGIALPPLTKTIKCAVQACPGDCSVSEWTSFDTYLTYFQQMSVYGSYDSQANFRGVCSRSCGGGERAQYRYVKTPALNGGAECPALVRFVPCNEQYCPVDGIVGEWTSYGDYDSYYQSFYNSGYLLDSYSYQGTCTKTCGGGTRYLFRPVVQFPLYGGKALPTLYKEVECNVQACPVNCVVSSWVNYDGTQLTPNGQGSAQFSSSCSASCGGGFRPQIRAILKYPSETGLQCPTLARTVACNNTPCPVDCVVSQWNTYESYGNYASIFGAYSYFVPQASYSGSCSATCGNGKQTAYRFVVTDVKFGGKECPALTKVINCNPRPCPGDCVLSDWASYDSYSQIAVISSYSAADRKKVGVCSKSCTAANGVVGSKVLFRTIVTQPSFGGQACDVLTKTVPCNDTPCPIDAVVGEWAFYDNYQEYFLASYGYGAVPAQNTFSGICSATCGGGVRTVYRQLITKPQFGGKPAPALAKTITCSTQACPVDCVLSDWSYYSADQYEYSVYGTCSQSCGSGSVHQYRTVLEYPSGGGIECPQNLTRAVPCNTQACPVDAVVSSWVAYSSYSSYYNVFNQFNYAIIDEGLWNRDGVCSASCGGGYRVEYRYIITAAANGGKPAPPLSRKVRCGTVACPVDCVLGEWVIFGANGGYSAYTPGLNNPSDATCSRSCGNGTRTITRNIIKPAAFGGKACGDSNLTRVVPCNTQHCPVDAIVTEWSFYTSAYGEYNTIGQCTVTCGNGTRAQFRKVTTPAAYGGRPAPALSRNVECNTNPCPSDCQVSSWANYGPSDPKYKSAGRCSVTCGGGTFEQFRTVVSYNQEGGAACPTLIRTLPCNNQSCPGDCIVTQWNYYDSSSSYYVPGVAAPTDCSVSCGGGVRTVFRKVASPAQNNGKKCPALSKTVTCNIAACAVDCEVSSWSDYPLTHSEYLSNGVCTRTCGLGLEAGVRGQFRTVTVVPQYGGKVCPALTRNVKCNEIACPQDCVVSQWAVYDDNYGQSYAYYTVNAQQVCSVSCGGGVRKLTRTVVTPALAGGAACPVLTKEVACNTAACPIDCVVADWAPYNPIASNGALGNLDNLCTKSCGTGTRRVVRQIQVYPQYGGKDCGEIVRDVPCNTQDCPVDAVVSEWSYFKPTYSAGGIISSYQAISSCSVTCGGGVRTQYRTIITPAGFGGRPAPALTQQVPCGTDPCPGDAVLSEWSDFSSTVIQTLGGSVASSCSKSCGGGVKTQFRKIIQVAQYGGQPAGNLTRLVECNVQACPVDCAVSEWAFYNSADANYAYYGRCSVTCGGGETRAYRVVTRYSAYGGKACPDLTKVVACNEFACPVDCVVGSWSQYESYDAYFREFRTQKTFFDSFNWGGICSKTCGGGARQQYRAVVTQPLNGGRQCPDLARTVACNLNACPVDCVVSNWAVYGPGYDASLNPYNAPISNFCSKTCGDGTTTQYRSIVVSPSNGGLACPPLTQEVPCNVQACPNDCKLGDWADYQPNAYYQGCSKSCGSGFKRQFRPILQHPLNGGAACVNTNRTIACNEQPCPVDCVVSEWTVVSSYGVTQCSKTCGGGVQTAIRKILTTPLNGGKPCPAALTQDFPCNVEPCPCPPVRCTHVCIEGYVTDGNNCATCQCVVSGSSAPSSDAVSTDGYLTGSYIVPAPYVPAPAPNAPSPAPYAPSPAPYAPSPAPYAPVPETYAPAPASYVPAPAPYAPAPYVPAPAPYAPAPVQYVPAPAPYVPAPAPYVPAPAPYVPEPVQYVPTPAPYVPAPAPYVPAPYVPAPVQYVPTPAPYVPTPAPYVPAPVQYVPTPAPYVPAPYVPAPVQYVPTPAPYVPAPAPYVPAPAPYVPAPAPYVPTPAPYVHTPAPYVPTPAPYVHTAAPYVPAPAPYVPAPAPYVPTPAPYVPSKPAKVIDACATQPCPLNYECLNVPSATGFPYTCLRTSGVDQASTFVEASSPTTLSATVVVLIVGAVVAAVLIVVVVALKRNRGNSAPVADTTLEDGNMTPEFANPLYNGSKASATTYQPVDF